MTQPRPIPLDTVWTIPNAISALRIVLILVFGALLWTHADGWAVAALAGAAVSDFLDGFLARRWQQVTALGRILDPTADRLLTIAVVLGLAFRSIIPWWLVAVLMARDIVVGVALLYGRRHGIRTPQVTRLGKWATAALYLFLPLSYLAFERWDAVYTVAIIGSVAAAGLYWNAGIGYVRDVRTRSSAVAVEPAGEA